MKQDRCGKEWIMKNFINRFFDSRTTTIPDSRNQKENHASALVRGGDGCRFRGDFKEAMEYLQQEEALCRELDDKAGLSRNLGNQAIILDRWGQLDKAMEYHKQEEALCRELDDKAGLSRSLSGQAGILNESGQRDKAMEYHKQEEALCRELGDKASMFRSLGSQVSILHSMGQLDKAMEYMKQQEVLNRELGDVNGLAGSLFNQSSVLGFEMGKPKEGLIKAQECRAIATKYGNIVLLQHIQKIITRIQHKLGPKNHETPYVLGLLPKS
jgi:tetratricopeptide (TPR) repeat protein